MIHGAFVPIHAAAARQRQIQQAEKEEEDMTRYTREELENEWEFKIVRSASGAFKNPDVLEDLLEEEAHAGWEMVEKFDDNRIRFKRPASARKRDIMLPEDVDPYRTQYGGLPGRNVAIILGVVLLLLFGGAILFFTQVGGGFPGPNLLIVLIISGLILLGLVVFLAVALSRTR